MVFIWRFLAPCASLYHDVHAIVIVAFSLFGITVFLLEDNAIKCYDFGFQQGIINFELNMSSFKIGLAVTVSLLICLGVGKAHVDIHQHDKRNVKFLANNCTCKNSSDCLPWCSCQSGICRCGGREKFALTGNIIWCRNYMFSSPSLLKKCHCLTSDSNSDKVYVGRCSYYTCDSYL